MQQGSILVRIQGANLHRSTEWIGKMDPYCKIMYGNQVYETKKAEGGGKTPTWGDSFVFRLEQGFTDIINVEVWDKDMLSKNDLVGQGTQRQVLQVPLTYHGKDAGSVMIEAEYNQDVSAFQGVAGKYQTYTQHGTTYQPQQGISTGVYPQGTTTGVYPGQQQQQGTTTYPQQVGYQQKVVQTTSYPPQTVGQTTHTVQPGTTTYTTGTTYPGTTATTGTTGVTYTQTGTTGTTTYPQTGTIYPQHGQQYQK